MNSRLERLQGSVTVKVLLIGLLLLVLLIPLAMIEELIAERSRTSTTAADEIAGAWGRAQTIAGPVLAVPFRYARYFEHGVTDRVTDEAYFLPEELTIEGGADTEILHRGLYEVPVYTASLSITGRLRPATFDDAVYDELEVLWSEAALVLPVSDARAIEAPLLLTVGGATADFQPGGMRIPGLGDQLVVPLAALGLERLESARAFSFELGLQGTGALRFLPFGDVTSVELRSAWPSPSFAGAHLPDRREVGADGFSATWRVGNLGRGYPPTWRRSQATPPTLLAASTALPSRAQSAPLPAPASGVSVSSFGVDLVVPVDVHAASLRATKYAALFLGLTFVAFFLFEVFTGLRLHALHYLCVGMANATFYLLLLALAEHVGFVLAYVLSALAATGLIGSYAAAILQQMRRALPIVGLLAGIYAYLYLTLTAEDYALLAGSFALFGLLAAFMHLTRRVDWYALGFAPAGPERQP